MRSFAAGFVTSPMGLLSGRRHSWRVYSQDAVLSSARIVRLALGRCVSENGGTSAHFGICGSHQLPHHNVGTTRYQILNHIQAMP